MNDRELLEMAAKAWIRSGMHLECPDDEDGIYVCRDKSRNGHTWNPLTYDGDALRLAVTCKIALNPMLVDGLNRNLHESAAGGVNRWTDCREKHNGDPFAATRRAIVRAAAEIGKAM